MITEKGYRILVAVTGRFQKDAYHDAEKAFMRRLKTCGVSAGPVSFGVVFVEELTQHKDYDERYEKQDEAEVEPVQAEEEVAGKSPEAVIDLKCSAKTARGNQCKYNRVPDSELCKVHTRKMQEGDSKKEKALSSLDKPYDAKKLQEDEEPAPEPTEPLDKPESEPDIITGKEISGLDALQNRLREK